MKQTILLLLLITFSNLVISQNADNKWAIGIDYGTLEYKGDLGDQFNDFNDWKDGLDLSLIKYISPSFDGVFHFDYNLVDESGPLPGEINRFYGKLFNLGADLRYKLNNGYIFKEDALFQPFGALGFGFLAGNASGKSMANSAAPYDKNVSSLDFYAGIGTKIKVSERVSLSLEVGQLYITKDDFDEATTLVDGNDKFRRLKGGLVITLGKLKDSDNDGVQDRKDECPDTPEGVAVDEKGCPIDTDGDGVADYMDDCVDVVGLESLKGCPDKDGDGIADKDDDCPDVAGIKELKGCPDTDKDGVKDSDDKCPDTPKGYKVDENGCPLDNDGDGIVNEEDNCPEVAGVPEEKGCPKKPTITKVPVTLDKPIEPVYFTVNGTYITNYSKNKLDRLVSILKENESYEIVVNGHTDSTAGDDYNYKLSEARIASVIKYLTEKGISKSRIKATKAFGETKPVKPNDTAEGRQQNRRVEFQLMNKVAN